MPRTLQHLATRLHLAQVSCLLQAAAASQGFSQTYWDPLGILNPVWFCSAQSALVRGLHQHLALSCTGVLIRNNSRRDNGWSDNG